MSTTADLPTLPSPGPPTTPGHLQQRLGHDCASNCAGGCAGEDPALGSVWFAWRRGRPGSALIVVDTTPMTDALAVRRLLRRVNTCTRPQRIKVLARLPDDCGRALASLFRRPMVSA